jgi:ABC-2 type transport system permease protein
MNAVIARRVVRDRRRWLFGWSVGIAGTIVVTVGFWPSLRGRADELNKLMDGLPEGLKSMFGLGGGIDPFSSLGYLSSKVFSLTVPVLLLVAGIALAAAPAGDEEHGLLETTYSLPVTRRRVVAERGAAFVFLTGVLALVTFLSTWIAAVVVRLDVGVAALLWSCVAGAALTWAVGGIALLAGAASGRRATAVGVASVVAVASYLVTSLADAGIAVFTTLKPISLFSHYEVVHALVHGRPTWGLLVLLGVAVIALAGAVWVIDRRDLRAG